MASLQQSNEQPIEAESLARIDFSAVLIDTLNASMHRD
jgi:hypothetical protein